MSNVSKNSASLLTTLLFLLLVAKMIGVALFWFLPLEGKEIQKHYNIVPDFIHIDLARSFGFIQRASSYPNGSTTVSSSTASSLILKGFYGNDKKGYALLAKKDNDKKVLIVAIGESIDGYRLKAIHSDGVVFSKSGKEFLLKLEKIKTIKAEVRYEDDDASMSEDGVPVTVQDSDVKYFAKNPREIWKNISIQEKRKNGKIEGFEIKWIKPGSKFAALGLKKGDLIIKANNKRLQSYKDAFDIYKKIDKLDEVSIVVLRNNQEKELVYEINR